jgi:hypothetical protein
VDYAAVYDGLIARARGRSRYGYMERHHIVPKCMGGGNCKDNLVHLTAKEHFIAHKLLVRIYPKVYGLAQALIAMGRLAEFKSRIFASERQRAAELRKGFKYSKASRAKMSESAKARGRNGAKTEFKPGTEPWNKGLAAEQSHRYGYKHLAETKVKVRDIMLDKGIRPPAPPKGFHWGKGGILVPKKTPEPLPARSL